MSALRRALQMLWQDLRWLPRSLWVNVLGASVLTPRPVRALIYRSVGIGTATMNIAEHCTFNGRGPIRIGRGSFVNTDCVFDAFGPITIGSQCTIAMQVLIATSGHGFAADGEFDRAPTGMPVTIGDRCWIGARSTILPGVTVGAGCVIAAGAVVAGDCEPNSLYAGVPARKIRTLQTPHTDESVA